MEICLCGTGHRRALDIGWDNEYCVPVLSDALLIVRAYGPAIQTTHRGGLKPHVVLVDKNTLQYPFFHAIIPQLHLDPVITKITVRA